MSMSAVDEVPVVVMGEPVVVNGIVITAPHIGVDAVPLIDAETAGILATVTNYKITQRVRWAEAITQGCIEQSNVYDIFDADNGRHIMVAIERSDDCVRCCCAPGHSLTVEFKNVAASDGAMLQANKDTLAALPSTMTMERPGLCSEKPGLCCCVLTPACADGMVMHAGGLDGAKAGTVLMNGPNVMGYCEVPAPFGGGFTPTINIMDRGAGEGDYRPIAKVEGPMCFGGCSELCLQTEWPVSKMSAPEQVQGPKIKSGDLAKILKKTPRSLGDALKEACTDSDEYTMQFAEGSGLAPQQKAMMLASLVLVDYMFFEQDNGMINCRNNELNITLCECYCLGCLCPCNIACRGQDGGGGAPTQAELSR